MNRINIYIINSTTTLTFLFFLRLKLLWSKAIWFFLENLLLLLYFFLQLCFAGEFQRISNICFREAFGCGILVCFFEGFLKYLNSIGKNTSSMLMPSYAEVSKKRAFIDSANSWPSSNDTFLSFCISTMFPTNVMTTPSSPFSAISYAQSLTLRKFSRL